jgi:hypothetical protein
MNNNIQKGGEAHQMSRLDETLLFVQPAETYTPYSSTSAPTLIAA